MQRKSKAFNVRKSLAGLNSSAWKPVNSSKTSPQKEPTFNEQTSTSSIRDTEDIIDHLEERMMTDLKTSEAFSQKNDGGKSELHFNKHVDEVFKCRCNVCWEGRRIKSNITDQSPEAEFFKEFHFHSQENAQTIEKDFVFILKRLAPNKGMSNTLRLFIPDTACFIQSECRFIAYTGKVYESTNIFSKKNNRIKQ